MLNHLDTGPDNASARLLLAHGAGAPMTSPFMDAFTALLAERRVAMTRFEFAYMAQRRSGGPRKPPPRAERLMPEFVAAIDAIEARLGPKALVIGGKSLGGRVASMIAAQMHDEHRAAGLVCLGYPLHPPGRSENLRAAHLYSIACPALIVQGERDPFGSRAEIDALTPPLPPSISFVWMPDGDHDFGPRGNSGFTRKANLAQAADAVAAFMARVQPSR